MDLTRNTADEGAYIGLLRGIQPVTEDCHGPELSTYRGMDRMCCSRCFILRQQIHRELGSFILNPLSIQYMITLGSRIPDSLTSCVLARCGRDVLYIPPGRTGLRIDHVIELVKKQFLLWKEMNLTEDTLTAGNVGYTKHGVPIIFPGNDCRQVENPSDEGISIKGDKLHILDREKAARSGKWMHVINCYELLEILFQRNLSPYVLF